ncbi:MAG: mRNA surveillance protein pelota [Candidatus Micrarchaeota archaeon]
MHVIRFDQELSELKAKVESLEDLWFLQKLIEKGDVLLAVSFRRFKSDDKLRPDSGEKKMVHLELLVEETEIAENANKLRVSGKILSGSPPEFAQKGAHHTIDLELKSVFSVRKEFLPYHKKLISESKKKAAKVRALIVVLDDHKALLANLRNDGIKFLFELENSASKREPAKFKKAKDEFFAEILEAISRETPERILIASPGFSKEEFQKFAKEKNPTLEKAFMYDHVSNAEKSAIYELLKKGALERLISEQKMQTEFEQLERLKASLGKNDHLSVYGVDEVTKAIDANAVETLLIEDLLLRKDRALNNLMQKAENHGAKIVIFNSEDEAGLEFSAFKIAAMLRYRLT